MVNGLRGRLAAHPLVACGIIGPPLFVIVLLVEGATRPDYSAWRQPGSALSLGPGGWVQVVNFVVTGVLVLMFAASLRRHSRAGSILVAIFALALVVSGIFVTDPANGYPPGTPPGPPASVSLHGGAHSLAGVVAFTALPAACLVFARWFTRQPLSKAWALYSGGTGLIVAGAVVLYVVASGNQSLRTNAGLLQRVAIVAGWTWLTMLAVHLIRNPNAHGT